MKKESYLVYDEDYDYISLLPLEERGKVWTAIFEYRLYGDVDIQLSESGTMAFRVIKNHIDRDTQKYSEMCEKNAINGKLGGRPRKNQTVSKKPNGFQKNPNDNDNDNDNVTDTDTDTDTELPKGSKEESIKEERRKRFLPPSLDEVKSYCVERGNYVNAEQFIDFYTANGWVQSRGKPIKDWKAAVRTWERNNLSTNMKGINNEDNSGDNFNKYGIPGGTWI